MASLLIWRRQWNLKIQTWPLCSGWTHSNRGAPREKKKRERERDITWSVEEETFLRIRERCLKETEFISAQQMLIYHLPCTSTEHHSKIENENHVESVVQQESEKWERMNSVHPRRVVCEHGHWLPRNPRGGVWKQVRDMDIKGGKTKREE